MVDQPGNARGSEFVQEIFDIWRSRYVVNGIDFNDSHRLEGRIESWAEWCSAFSDMGDQHASYGEEALDRDSPESAAHHFTQASAYYHFGSHVWHVDEEERAAAHQSCVDTYRRGGALLDPPVERIEAPACGPDGDATVFANLRIPDSPTDAPVVLLFPGLDSTKEEMSAYEPYILERGMATLAIEGPGQGETWLEHRMSPEYHSFISDAIDYVDDQEFDGIDLQSIGALGQSLGGYYAPHVAANDQRIDACVGLSGPFTVGPVSHWDFDLAREQFLHACKTEDMAEVDEIADNMSLRDDIDDLTVPCVFITGGLDRIVPSPQTKRLADRAQNAEFWLYEDGNHNCQNYHYECRPRAADWLRDQLSG